MSLNDISQKVFRIWMIFEATIFPAKSVPFIYKIHIELTQDAASDMAAAAIKFEYFPICRD